MYYIIIEEKKKSIDKLNLPSLPHNRFLDSGIHVECPTYLF